VAALLLTGGAGAAAPVGGQDVFPPHRSRAELEAHRDRLITERAALLDRYTPLHPSVAELTRQIEVLNSQIDMLEPPPETGPPRATGP
jgi:hypothetical protein